MSDSLDMAPFVSNHQLVQVDDSNEDDTNGYDVSVKIVFLQHMYSVYHVH